MRILFTGGGTGGHFFPIIAVAREVKKIAEENQIIDLELYYLGPSDGHKNAILKQENIAEVAIAAGKIRRYFSWHNFLDVFKTIFGFFQTIWNFFFIMPDVVFSKGGYGAFTSIIACFIFRIPLVIHESDAVPGKVNLFSIRFAQRIGIAFSSAASFFPKDKTALVGIPIRREILGGSSQIAKNNLGISPDLPVIGFIGASQGSRTINDAVLGVLKDLTNEYEVLHQCGSENLKDVQSESSVVLDDQHKARYHLFGFLEEKELRDFYAASDLLISRAGGSSIYEIASNGKPSIIVPLGNSAQDHQRKNAYEYSGAGACVIVEDSNLTPHILLGDIKKIILDSELLHKMSEAAKGFARMDSAEVIARELLTVGEH